MGQRASKRAFKQLGSPAEEDNSTTSNGEQHSFYSSTYVQMQEPKGEESSQSYVTVEEPEQSADRDTGTTSSITSGGNNNRDSELGFSAKTLLNYKGYKRQDSAVASLDRISHMARQGSKASLTDVGIEETSENNEEKASMFSFEQLEDEEEEEIDPELL